MKISRFLFRLSLAGFLFLGASEFRGAAQAGEPLPPVALWPGDVPGEKGDIPEEANQPNRPGDTIIRTGNVSKPTLTVFRPPADKDTGTAVVICPGGGYNILAWNLEGTEVAEWLNTIGVTGIVLKYRVPGRKGLEKHTAALQDVQRAIGVVRQRAKEWGLNPERIGVLGFSAGGHLAATLSNNYAARTYDPVDDADKESCRPDFTLLIYPGYLVDKANVLAPELKVTSETPRTFIAMTEDDGVRVDGPLIYYLALKNAKVPAEMHLYPDGGHGYGLRPSSHLVSTWPQRAEQWLGSLGMLKPAQ
jgi:acetyl esterase/lipase